MGNGGKGTGRRLLVFGWLVGASVLGMEPATRAATSVSGEVGGQHWTPAGNPYTVEGPTTVAAGTSLAIEAGTSVVLTVPSTQTQAAILVNGTLEVTGSRDNPVTFDTIVPNPDALPVINPSCAISNLGNVLIQGAIFRHARTALCGGAMVVQQSTFEDNQFAAIQPMGTAELDGIIVRNCNYGVWINNALASVKLTNSLLLNNRTDAVGANRAASVSVVNCTIDGNSDGVYLFDVQQAVVRNSIITKNAFGVQRAHDTPLVISDSDVFGNGHDYDNATPGAGCISVDPLYLGAGDFHLSPASPVIDIAAAAFAPPRDLDGHPRPSGAGFDLGAYEVVPGVGGQGSGGSSGTGGAPGLGGASGTGGATGSGETGSGGTGDITGTGGASAGSGGADAGGAPGDAGDGDAGGLGHRLAKNGCGCATAEPGSSAGVVLAIGVGLTIASAGRRRRRRPR